MQNTCSLKYFCMLSTQKEFVFILVWYMFSFGSSGINGTVQASQVCHLVDFLLQGVERPYYDVVIVGSGPSGACLGYYLVKKGRKVLTLEKKTFPRDKICGDALCKTGIEILKEMGLYDKLLKENKAHVVSL